ncbi:MAG TPA: hypothetical protein VGL57_02795 [Solirubrobacteraceae bacterium]|jgi:hypothetical protein
MALLLVPAGAAAVEPVLEFVVPGNAFPVAFTTEGGAVTAEMAGFASVVNCSASHGEGELTGPRSAVAKYVFTGCVTEHGSSTKCQSATALNEGEITTGQIPAELVYISQAKHAVAILLNPDNTLSEDIVYMTFKCGGESVEARGPFLAAVGPVNQEANSFTTTLSQLAGAQTPDEYENLRGEMFKAIPEASREGNPFVTTGVASTITVHSAVSGTIRAISAEEVLTKQHEEEAQRQHAAEVKQQEEAAAKRHQEEAAAAKKHEEEEVAAATKKRQEEEAAAGKQKRQEEAAKRKRLLAKALRQCKRQPTKHRRAQCEARAKRRYGAKRKQKRK